MSTYPIAYHQVPPRERSRLTVFFRLIMVIPHAIVAFFYGIAALLVAVGAWFAILVVGRYPDGMYNFVAGYLRYYTRMETYALLVCDAYPPFDGAEHPEYPVTVRIASPPARLSRLSTLARVILLIPVAVIVYVFTLWVEVVAVAIWFVAVITGKTSAGLMDTVRFPWAYITRARGYGLLMTDIWPTFEG